MDRLEKWKIIVFKNEQILEQNERFKIVRTNLKKDRFLLKLRFLKQFFLEMIVFTKKMSFTNKIFVKRLNERFYWMNDFT